MDRTSRHQDRSDDDNHIAMTKTTYWEIYGVKRFTYRGQRKYTPSLYQSFDGGVIIRNDVFGLTIRQFEREFKACLERRKTREQWILNLRFPDKSSKEYLEYLENCTDKNKGHLHWFENHQREQNLYEHLVKTVGTEIEIRTRQRLFIIQDMIVNACMTDAQQISSGSLSEGLDLPGSDMDIMHVYHKADVIPNDKSIRQPIQNDTYVMETDTDFPGFTRLRMVARLNENSINLICLDCPPRTYTCKCYIEIDRFHNLYTERFPNLKGVIHGPCITDQKQTIDVVLCLHSTYLPDNAIAWASRHRLQWPPNFVIERILNYGCLLVPIGPKTVQMRNNLWRLSFSVAEKILVHSFDFTQLLCYGLLKLSLKRIVNTNNDAKDLLCSYFLKTALFWVSEEVDIDIFQLSKLYFCFSLCLDKLISWVKACCCPNYFIPEHNMFLGKINQINNNILLHVLESVKYGGIDGLLHNLFRPDNLCSLGTLSESSFVLLDFLLFRNKTYMTDTITSAISNCYKAGLCCKSLLKSESSTFINDVCKFFNNTISHEIAQRLPPPNTMDNNKRKCYHTNFKHIIKIDAVSGWLLYASLYYVTRQYNATLEITDYVLSKWSPHMLFIDSDVNNDMFKQKIIYRQNVHASMTLNERLTIATAQHVHYCQHSSLIPEELQLETEFGDMNILPNIMSRCLRFLCYHHLGYISNRQRALRDLYSTVKDKSCRSLNTESNALTILGVCCEISGDKDMAYQCYDEALQSDHHVCPSADTRRSKLFDLNL
ncbi:uncharacterized protein LOC134694869 [Mytilus trossulus]|uniref:uncharacterized protein LOC134694869 n=1 Tax=Mytilus trossulus TaxID=6551 RepID=UPI003007B00B